MELGNDETIETKAVIIRNLSEIIAPNVIRKQHEEIGSDLVQRIQMMLDRSPTIEAYSVEKDWTGNAAENLKLKLGNALLTISLRAEK